MFKYIALFKLLFTSSDAKSDIIAGITVSLILIPQSMAYAQLAGLPPHYGLYASLIPPVLAAIFGSSNHLSTGPVAIASLMTAAALAPLASTESEYVLLAALLALILGLVQISFGLLRMGVLVNLLSHPVIVGFTNAAALIIATSQLPKLFGIAVEISEKHYETVWHTLEIARHETHVPTLLVAIGALVLMIAIRRINNRIPYILVALVVTTCISWVFNAHPTINAIAVIGAIPQGLPKLTFPALTLSGAFSLLTTAVIIALIAFAEAMAVAQAIAAKTKQRIDANKELVGQGIANVAAAFTQGFPVAGSFSRSAVNIQAGAKTKLSSAVTSFIVLSTLLFFTRLLYYIPQSALAAIIILAVSGLINPNKIRHIWHTSRHDAFAAMLTFTSTLYFAPELEIGLAIGVGFSLIFYLYQNSRPKVSFLSVYKDGQLHDAKRLELAQCDNIAVVRFEAPLFFANANILEQEILKELVNRPNIQQILIVGSAMVNVDATGEEKISELVNILRDNGKDVYFSALQSPVIDVFNKTGLLQKIGKKNIFTNAEDAIEYLAHHTPNHTDQAHCPLLNYIHEQAAPDLSRIHAVKNIMSNFYRIFGSKQLLKLRPRD